MDLYHRECALCKSNHLHCFCLTQGSTAPTPHFSILHTHTGTNSSLLDAFFYGKAFAETLNEKLGTALDDLLANAGKQDAERREALRCCLCCLMHSLQWISKGNHLSCCRPIDRIPLFSSTVCLDTLTLCH